MPPGQTDRQVLTVTLNAALDVTYASAVFRWGEQNRVEEVHSRAGGKGVNVARVLAQLGVDCTVTGLAGGPTGRAIRKSLDAEGLESELVEIIADSRRTVVAVSRSTGEVTEFDERGPVVRFEEWLAFEARFEELVRRRRAVVLAGSLPPGLPADAYRHLSEAAARHGVPVVLDTSGPALPAGLAGRPSLVKPNAKELLEASAGWEGSTEVVDAALELQRRGAQTVVVSLGPEGLLAVTPEGAWRATPPHVSGNPVGAGDTVVAALVAGMLEGRPWPERLRRAAALSAAAVAHPVAGGFDAGRFPELLEMTRVEGV